MSNVDYHRYLLRDRERVMFFREAISRAVRPGDRVLDVGTGTGVLAVLAALCGAKEVIAIDDGPIASVAERVIRDAGVADRVRVIRGRAPYVLFDDNGIEANSFDVVLAEIVGTFGVDENMLSVIPACAPMFSENARIIPARVRMYAGLFEYPDFAGELRGLVKGIGGVSFAALANEMRRTPQMVTLSSAGELSASHLMFDFDLSKRRAPEVSRLTSSMRMRAERSGTVHGIGLWVDVVLDDETTIYCGPSEPTTSWRHGFLTAEAPLDVETGEIVDVDVETDINGTFWKWSFTHRGRRHHQTGPPLDVDRRLLRMAETELPPSGPVGNVVEEILLAMKEHRTARSVVDALQRSRGATDVTELGFRDEQHALRFVTRNALALASTLDEPSS